MIIFKLSRRVEALLKDDSGIAGPITHPARKVSGNGLTAYVFCPDMNKYVLANWACNVNQKRGGWRCTVCGNLH